MSNCDDIEDLAITISTLQLDPRRTESHKFHQSWLSLVSHYKTQLEELAAAKLITPSVIESVSDRQLCHEKIRMYLIKSLAEILQAEDVTSTIAIFNTMLDSLSELRVEHENVYPLSSADHTELIDYLKCKSYILSLDSDLDTILKSIGSILKTLSSLFRVDITIKDEFEDDEVEDKDEIEDKDDAESEDNDTEDKDDAESEDNDTEGKDDAESEDNDTEGKDDAESEDNDTEGKDDAESEDNSDSEYED